MFSKDPGDLIYKPIETYQIVTARYLQHITEKTMQLERSKVKGNLEIL